MISVNTDVASLSKSYQMLLHNNESLHGYWHSCYLTATALFR